MSTRAPEKTVAVGMSGGVDSSVCAILLKEMGYEVIGLSMEIYDKKANYNLPKTHACYGPDEDEELKNAEALCKRIGIPFFRVDLRKEFSEFVILYFKKEYLSGRTPNPCIVCNRTLKFDFLIKKAKEQGVNFDLFATGHYAIVEKAEDGRYRLKKAKDKSKDQSYFLYRLRQEHLARTIFPLGTYIKKDVIKIACRYGLNVEDMKESQDFVSGGNYSFLFNKDEIVHGDIVDSSGKRLGTHRGIMFYTVGQRKGLGISAPKPLYVKSIEPENNRIVVGEKEEIYSHGLIAEDINIIRPNTLKDGKRYKVKIRLNHRGAPALVKTLSNGRLNITFDEPQLAITPGQSAVLYDGDEVIGGGVIKSVL